MPGEPATLTITTLTKGAPVLWSLFRHPRPRTRDLPNCILEEEISLDKISDVHWHLLDLSAVELFDFSHHADILSSDEVNGNTLTSETSTTTDTMDVVLTVGWEIVVDDQGNLLNIDTTGQKISGDQDTG